MTISQAAYRSVAELAQGKLPSQPTFQRIFNVQAFDPACRATPELSKKYGTNSNMYCGVRLSI